MGWRMRKGGGGGAGVGRRGVWREGRERGGEGKTEWIEGEGGGRDEGLGNGKGEEGRGKGE